MYARTPAPTTCRSSTDLRRNQDSIPIQLLQETARCRGGRICTRFDQPAHGCLNVFGISAWNHVISLLGVQFLAEGAFQLFQGRMGASR